MALEPAKLADFKVAGALGAGATARVYEAVHLATGRLVAIKIMEQTGSVSEIRERFAREALLLSGVESRHVGKILGYGFEKGQPFLVLERLHGETLDAKLRRDGPVPPPIAVRWIEQLIIGVRDCHDAKVIHRDIKPSNVFVHHEAGGEMVKLIDFGVARLREITGEASQAQGLTTANHLIGSMGYMAPEQFTSAKTVNFQADLYAVGVVVFRTITGRLPFVSRSIETIIKMKSEQAAPQISSMPGMVANTTLDWFVQKATARDPEHRFRTAREMLEQWWHVIASLDQGVAAPRDPHVGRVDESYAGPRPRASSAPDVYPDVYEEENTIRRPAINVPTAATTATAAHLPPPRPRPPPNAPEDGVPATIAPATEPLNRSNDETIASAGPVVPPPLARDPFDLPTRSHPDLRKLVEKELELQRLRKEKKT